MNALTPPRARLDIDVVHDLVCPWCYIGLRRLLRALARRPELSFALHWWPFLLNPDMPPSGLAAGDYASRRFGGEERARRLYASITTLGRQEGIDFRFDRIRRIPSSVAAHRLVGMAAANGRGTEAVEALFAAHFTAGRDISDFAVLLDIAAACGLDGPTSYLLLTAEAETESVHAANLRAHRLGVNGVPCFLFSGRFALAGAQEPEVIERLLDVALAAQGTP
jgi:predicted DsbA family dithiol-disulfide isomerase